jgi:hypothetical protein
MPTAARPRRSLAIGASYIEGCHRRSPSGKVRLGRAHMAVGVGGEADGWALPSAYRATPSAYAATWHVLGGPGDATPRGWPSG